MLQAQSDYSARKATSRLSIGAGASLGVALPVGGSFRDSSEAAPGVGVRAGLNITYPVTRSIGVLFNIGIDSRGIGKKPKGQTDNLIWRASYLFLEPGVAISAFRLSLNIGLPMSLSAPIEGTPGGGTRDDGDFLEKMVEMRVGGTLVLMDRTEGWLGLTVDAGFPFNKLYVATVADANPEDIHSMHAFSAHIGLTWQFAIPGTGGL
jgi:hypothetical protein